MRDNKIRFRKCINICVRYKKENVKKEEKKSNEQWPCSQDTNQKRIIYYHHELRIIYKKKWRKEWKVLPPEQWEK